MSIAEDRRVLSEWVERGMEAKRLNQTKLAKTSGVSRDTISRVILKKTGISRLNLEKLARALGTPAPKLSDAAFEEDEESQTGSARAAGESAFVIGVEAMLETMRKQVKALDHLVGEAEEMAPVHTMLGGMTRQIESLRILLLDGRSMDVLVEDMKDGSALLKTGDRVAEQVEKDRRSGRDRRTG